MDVRRGTTLRVITITITTSNVIKLATGDLNRMAIHINSDRALDVRRIIVHRCTPIDSLLPRLPR
ncbi:hypothetical protein D3C85_1779130 [compost metagenome]